MGFRDRCGRRLMHRSFTCKGTAECKRQTEEKVALRKRLEKWSNGLPKCEPLLVREWATFSAPCWPAIHRTTHERRDFFRARTLCVNENWARIRTPRGQSRRRIVHSCDSCLSVAASPSIEPFLIELVTGVRLVLGCLYAEKAALFNRCNFRI